jgi:hypothetical protein
MILASIILPILCLLAYGKNIKQFSARHYVIAAVVALLQVSVAAYVMFTMQKPPLY